MRKEEEKGQRGGREKEKKRHVCAHICIHVYVHAFGAAEGTACVLCMRCSHALIGARTEWRHSAHDVPQLLFEMPMHERGF